MDQEKKEKIIEVLKMISRGAQNDAKNFDGQPFTGKTVGTYFGYCGASISRLSKIIIEILEEK